MDTFQRPLERSKRPAPRGPRPYVSMHVCMDMKSMQPVPTRTRGLGLMAEGATVPMPVEGQMTVWVGLLPWRARGISAPTIKMGGAGREFSVLDL